jgi:hypothetical protein
MKRSICLSFFLLLFSLLHAQEKLARKPWFGAQYNYTDAEKKTGCIITRIAGGTSQALKLQKDDIITQMGNSPIAAWTELPEKFRSYKLDELMEVKIIRNKKEMKLRAKVVGRAFETDDNAEVIYDQAAYKEGQLRVIINKPKKEGRMPAMLFIPGYTCSSIDNLTFDHPYKRIVDAYVDAGRFGHRFDYPIDASTAVTAIKITSGTALVSAGLAVEEPICRSFCGNILLQAADDVLGQRHIAVFFAFTLYDVQHLAIEVKVFKANVAHFYTAQTAAIHESK